jgi:hypothetical protein
MADASLIVGPANASHFAMAKTIAQVESWAQRSERI